MSHSRSGLPALVRWGPQAGQQDVVRNGQPRTCRYPTPLEVRANTGNLRLSRWSAVDIGPATPHLTPYPRHGEAAARLVALGDCRFGIILCGTGQGIMMAANKVKGIRCGVCGDASSARMIRRHDDANMLSIGARVVGEGLALDIVDAFLSAEFEGGWHAGRVEMIGVLEG